MAAAAFLALALALALPARAAITQTIHYQGFLTDKTSKLPIDKAKDMRFLLCDSASGDCSSPLFGETRCAGSSKAVSVVRGRYDVEIGSSTSGGIDASIPQGRSALWLEVQVDPNDDCAGFEALSPRVRIEASAFAFESLHASTAAAADAVFKAGTIASLPATANGGITISTNAFVSGRMAAGTTATSARFQVNDPGAGTSNTTVLVSSGTSAGQELFIIRGDGKVGVGTTAPGSRLEVATSGASRIELDTSNPAYVSLKVNGTEVARLKP
jgi:hypothetical protein